MHFTLLVAGLAALVAAQPDAPITLRTVKHKEFLEALKAHKGRVIVVDFWGEFCIPCKKEFPHLVEMHRRWYKDGLVCISVSLDDAKRHDAALKFLKARGATFPNYRLDEEPKVWQDHWDFNGPPALFVFDRAGKQAGRFDHNDPCKQYTDADVEKLVQKVLRPGP